MGWLHEWVVVVLWAFNLILLVPMAVLMLQVFAAVAANRPAASCVTIRPKVAILMPAHNEADGIGVALRSVRPQLVAGDRLLVVADNCTDRTAEVAASLGAEVVERSDPQRRGKGYALDYGVRHLAADPPEVVVVVDADCELNAGCIERLAGLSASSGRPVQALYLMRAPAGAGIGARLGEFAWIVRNHVRPLGSRGMGWPCQLMGTGMALPWALAQYAPLASGHLVEDMELGLYLAEQGAAPLFCPAAIVISDFPGDGAARLEQRTRWEHGHVSLIGRVPRLLWRAFRTGRPSVASMALDLCVPPLALAALLLSIGLASSALWFACGGAVAPLIIGLFGATALGLSITLAWWRFGRQVVSLVELLTAPTYALLKLPIYVKLLVGRKTAWVRTQRGGRR